MFVFPFRQDDAVHDQLVEILQISPETLTIDRIAPSATMSARRFSKPSNSAVSCCISTKIFCECSVCSAGVAEETKAGAAEDPLRLSRHFLRGQCRRDAVGRDEIKNLGNLAE